MNKIVLQVSNIETLRDYKKHSAPIFLMSLLIKEDIVRRESGGLLFHFVTPGRWGIDFVCYSIVGREFPPKTGTGKIINIVKEKFAKRIEEGGDDFLARIKSGHFYGLNLPTVNDADTLPKDFFEGWEVQA